MVICDIAIAWETVSNMERIRNHKIDKYERIADLFIEKGYSVISSPVIVGSLGSWAPEHEIATKALGLPKRYVGKMIPLIVSQTIEQSKNIFWKHVFGNKYTAAPLYLPHLKPKGTTWEYVKPDDEDDSESENEDDLFHSDSE